MLRYFAALLVLVPVVAAAQPDAEGVYTITGPERTAAAVEAIDAEMPRVEYVPPAGRWGRLPRTAAILKAGGELRVVMLGDSIVNDTSRSAWEQRLLRNVRGVNVPGLTVTKVTSVRGGTGCWWYREPPCVQRYVLAHRPDLVVIGGISHHDDIAAVREVVRQIRGGDGPADILLMTPAFGTVDPADDAQWTAALDPAGTDFRNQLVLLADELQVGLLDMSAAWGRYVRGSGHEIAWFKRDVVHANERGEQILGSILAAYLTPDAE